MSETVADQQSGGFISPLFSSYADDPRVAPVIKPFVEALPHRVDVICSAFDRGDWTEVGRFAHQLKGAAGGYGYPELMQVCAKIEDMAKSTRDETAVRLALRDLRQLVQRAGLAFSRWS